MENRKLTTFEEFEAALLKDPEVLREYEALKPKYDKIQRMLQQRKRFG